MKKKLGFFFFFKDLDFDLKKVQAVNYRFVVSMVMRILALWMHEQFFIAHDSTATSRRRIVLVVTVAMVIVMRVAMMQTMVTIIVVIRMMMMVTTTTMSAQVMMLRRGLLRGLLRGHAIAAEEGLHVGARRGGLVAAYSGSGRRSRRCCYSIKLGHGCGDKAVSAHDLRRIRVEIVGRGRGAVE